MGRRWWQKEARAKAAQEKNAQKNASNAEEVQEVNVAVAAEETVTFEADAIVNEATVELIQTIAEISTDEAFGHEPEAEPESSIEEASVPGITVTTNNFNTSNKKKRRR